MMNLSERLAYLSYSFKNNENIDIVKSPKDW